MEFIAERTSENFMRIKLDIVWNCIVVALLLGIRAYYNST
jgi:hypothetical protein